MSEGVPRSKALHRVHSTRWEVECVLNKQAVAKGVYRVSYGRNPHYIYSDGETLFLDGYRVPETLINAFLYKVLLLNRRNELKERLREGKKEWTYMLRAKFSSDDVDFTTVTDSTNDPELALQIKWLDSQEDEVLKALMGEPSTETGYDSATDWRQVANRLDEAGFGNYEVHDGFVFLPLRGQSSLLERIRRGLANARIEHDDWDWMAEEVLRSLGE